MQDLQNLEIAEIEVLNLLNSIKVLDYLYFGGGTMLRLCHNLNRYSTDLDFWLGISADSQTMFTKIKNNLSKNYDVIDSANKRSTLLFQFRAPNVKRSLKIEIRKEQTDFDWERKIAFSKFTNKQVLLKGLTLQQMMHNKTEALISRKLIRDCFDIEFLLKRGTELTSDKSKLKKMLRIIEKFSDIEFKVTLGSIIEEKERKFYIENRFSFLKEEVKKNIK